MPARTGEIAFWCGLAAATATIAYDIVQVLQIAGVVRYPFDEILIYSTSLCIVVPFLLHIPAQPEHPFRFNVNTYSDRT